MKTNPWQDVYALKGNEDEVFKGLEFRASPLRLQGDTLEAKAEALKEGMRNVFLCGEQARQVLSKILAISQGHASSFCQSPQQVLAATYGEQPWGRTTQPAIVLTGLAGVGKSELVRALERLLLSRTSTVDCAGHQKLPHVPAWFMTLRKGANINSLIRPWIERVEGTSKGEHGAQSTPLEGVISAAGGQKKRDLNTNHLLALARRCTRRDGTCLLAVDELQFVSTSANANSFVTALLLNLLSIGPKFLYVTNFSLLHKLKKRSQEDQQRLLAHPILFKPDAVDSQDFADLLAEYFALMPDDFSFQLHQVVELVHQYTFGIRRAVVELLGEAWLIAKTARRKNAPVELDDIKKAYLSPKYSVYREDVEQLGRLQFGDRKVRADLVNPFPELATTPKVLQLQPAIEAFEKNVAERHLDNQMTPSQRSNLAALLGKTKPSDAAPQVIEFGRRSGKKADKDSLLSGLNQFVDEL